MLFYSGDQAPSRSRGAWGPTHQCYCQAGAGVEGNKVNPSNRAVRLPITPGLLLQLRGAWLKVKEGRDGHMLWAAAALCFFAFLRVGEMTVPSDAGYDEKTHLSFTDVAVNSRANPTMLKVKIKASVQSQGGCLCRQDGRSAMSSLSGPVLYGSKGLRCGPPVCL